jgi:hypothetical protein
MTSANRLPRACTWGRDWKQGGVKGWWLEMSAGSEQGLGLRWRAGRLKQGCHSKASLARPAAHSRRRLERRRERARPPAQRGRLEGREAQVAVEAQLSRAVGGHGGGGMAARWGPDGQQRSETPARAPRHARVRAGAPVLDSGAGLMPAAGNPPQQPTAHSTHRRASSKFRTRRAFSTDSSPSLASGRAWPGGGEKVWV